jgi:hypothetical protein
MNDVFSDGEDVAGTAAPDRIVTGRPRDLPAEVLATGNRRLAELGAAEEAGIVSIIETALARWRLAIALLVGALNHAVTAPARASRFVEGAIGGALEPRRLPVKPEALAGFASQVAALADLASGSLTVATKVRAQAAVVHIVTLAVRRTDESAGTRLRGRGHTSGERYVDDNRCSEQRHQTYVFPG